VTYAVVDIWLRGLTFPIAYWLVVNAAGLRLTWSNLRRAAIELRAVRPGENQERPLRASAVGHLVVHVALGLALLASAALGLGLLAGSLTSGLHLQFSSRLAAMVFVVVALGIPTAPSVIALLFWLWCWRTVRALAGESAAGPSADPN